MVKPIDPTRTKQISDPNDTDDPPTIFEVRCLTKREVNWLQDQAFSAYRKGGDEGEEAPVEMRGHSGTVRHLAIRLGLTGVQNYPIPFKATKMLVAGRNTQGASEEFLDTLPISTYDFVSREIQAMSDVDEDDMGKSSPPSTSVSEET